MTCPKPHSDSMKKSNAPIPRSYLNWIMARLLEDTISIYIVYVKYYKEVQMKAYNV